MIENGYNKNCLTHKWILTIIWGDDFFLYLLLLLSLWFLALHIVSHKKTHFILQSWCGTCCVLTIEMFEKHMECLFHEYISIQYIEISSRSKSDFFLFVRIFVEQSKIVEWIFRPKRPNNFSIRIDNNQKKEEDNNMRLYYKGI